MDFLDFWGHGVLWWFRNWPFFEHFLMSFRGYFLFPFYSLFNTFWVLKLEPKIVSKKSQKSTIFGLRENWPTPEPQNWSFFDNFFMSFRGYFLFPFYSLFNTFWLLKLKKCRSWTDLDPLSVSTNFCAHFTHYYQRFIFAYRLSLWIRLFYWWSTWKPYRFNLVGNLARSWFSSKRRWVHL